ncbi:hypothetical protein N0V84_010810 [Fusarium piperis]|uniref:Hsp70 family chaperone n=1 Tax=Fusarium piperis TaxID=1435070 RepID=A0A9W8W1A5_9HYPO|nr:hypothetical protein N0V84_010810 [Fusarium piperis]
MEIVTSWDAEFHHCSDVEKAPTQLWYDEDGNATWGYSIPADKDALKWFKLLLLKPEDLPADVSKSEQLTNARRLQQETGQKPIDIIACFLGKLWDHAMESIKRSIGARLLNMSKFYVVITLPAIWPPYAQDLMKQAAGLSGILNARSCGDTTLRFVSEPEAAALATIKDLSKRSTVKSGDTIVICDAGGGTVVSLPRLDMALGALCGGVFLDENFINLIKSKVPKGSWDQVSKAQERKFLNDGWEHGIKPQFANQDRPWLVDLPEACKDTTPRRLKRRRALELSSDEILSVFCPIVDKIEALVRRQYDAVEEKFSKPPNYIILVGGFGRSRYLFDRLRAKFTSTVLQSQGSRPWTAICRGAVVHELSKQNLSTQLGGDDITSKRPVRHSFYKLYSGPMGEVEDDIHCSASHPPPSRVDDTVRRMCQIKWNKQVCFESLPTYINPTGEVYRQLNLDVEMTCEDGTVDFMVYHNGTRVAAQNVEVEFD